MSSLVLKKDGVAVFAEEFSDEDWDMLKESYAVGDFFMPCCMSPAVPKTSPNFLKFFAHYSDECATSPESVWHLNTKQDVSVALRAKDIQVSLERVGGSSLGDWKADVYFEYQNRRIAIEIQKSYQQLAAYLKRQQRYKNSEVESYWLLYKPRYMTLIKSLGKYRIKNEYGGKFPSEGFIRPCLPELPISYYEIAEGTRLVKGAAFLECTLEAWIEAILANRFICAKNVWKIA